MPPLQLSLKGDFMSQGGKHRGRGATVPLEKIDRYRWRIPQKYKPGMRVPGVVFADEGLLEKIKTDRTLEQCANVAHLPGIYKYAITLPDGHEGYGFPIGGVAATDYEEGVISPGGVGYDINCGVRLLTTNLSEADIRPHLADLANTIFKNVPSGLGSRRKDFRLTIHELDQLVSEGVPWIVDKGLGDPKTLSTVRKGDVWRSLTLTNFHPELRNVVYPSGTLGLGITSSKFRRLTKFITLKSPKPSVSIMRGKLPF